MLRIAPLRWPAVCALLAAAPFLVSIGTHVGPLDVVFFITVEVAAWGGMLLQVLRQASKVGVPTTTGISKKVIVLDLPTGPVAVRWTALVRVKSTREFWLFRGDRRRWLIIPKRAFTEAERASLDEFVRQAAPVVAGLARRRAA